jgi:hypothetical protein
MSNPERIRTAATAFKDSQPVSVAISQRAPGPTGQGTWNLFNGSRHYAEHHASVVQPVTVTATGWRSTPRSNDGQTIFEVALQATARTLTCTFGRDGEIRTRGLLLPKQAR